MRKKRLTAISHLQPSSNQKHAANISTLTIFGYQLAAFVTILESRSPKMLIGIVFGV
jgi:hypothetical protein